jgi:uncharacterized protein (UPF0335 family)
MKSNEHPAASYIDRIVSLEEDVRGLRGDIKDIYTEAKEAGHRKGAIRLVVKRKMEDEDARLSREAIESEAEQIMAALGMLRGTPLGDAAAVRAGVSDQPVDAETASGYDAYQAGRKAGFIGAAYDNPYPEDDDRFNAYAKGWQEEQAKRVKETIKPTEPAPAKADGRKGRTMTEEQKRKMKEGRERVAAAKAASATQAAAE